MMSTNAQRKVRGALLKAAGLSSLPINTSTAPTANLDIHSSEVVHRILKGLTAQGETVLITTNNMKEVEEICDRVAILCKGRLVALDSPLALRRQHVENKVDAILSDGARHVFDLDREEERTRLGQQVAAGGVLSLKTREYDFHQAFLKLTGTAFE